jgi:Na+/H+-dicarboxylate symporter
MKAAPIGAFGAMAFTIGKFGTGAILNLIGLIATFYATAALSCSWCWASSREWSVSRSSSSLLTQG